MDLEFGIIILLLINTEGDASSVTDKEHSWNATASGELKTLIINSNIQHHKTSDDDRSYAVFNHPPLDRIGSSQPSCEEPGIFGIQGSCSDYYICEQGKLFKFSCLNGEVFDRHISSCTTKSSNTSLPKCTTISMSQDSHKENTIPNHQYHHLQKPIISLFEGNKRSKRGVVSPSITTSIAACSLTSVANDIVDNSWLFTGYIGKLENALQYLEDNLNGIKGKMEGTKAKISGLSISLIENHLRNRIRSQIRQILINSSKNHELDFEGFHRLNDQYLKNSMRLAMKQDLIRGKHLENESNLSQMHISIGELENLINEQVDDSMTHIKIGFNQISAEMRLSEMKPLIYLLLNVINGIQKQFRKLQSLSVDDSKKEEIESSGGILEYLEAISLEESMRDIILQNSAIPRDASDITVTFMIEFLVHCLKVHFYKLSSIVSLNVYLAAHSLNAKDVIGFNHYISKANSVVLKLKQSLGIGFSQGLIQEVQGVLRKVRNLINLSSIPNLDHVVHKSTNDINQIVYDAQILINHNTELPVPNTIIGEPDFSHSSVPVPNGKWELGKQVSYAIQILSGQGLSKIGIWSTPYTIQEKANPIIKLSNVETGIIRLVYRKFNQEIPDLIAIINDNNQTSLKDIRRDLIDAASRRDETQAVEEIIALIKDVGSDIDQHVERKMTALHCAAKHGNVKVMKILIDNGANIHAKSYDDQDALHFAAIFGSTEAVKYLVDNGEQLYAQTKLLGLSPLHLAVANNHVETTEILLDNGASINIKAKNGITPLHISVAGNGETTDILLDDANIDINAVDEEGLTALHYAVRVSKPDFAQKLLLCDGLDVDAESDSHLRPIHLAAISGNVLIILELHESGANLLSVDAYKSTALHYAAFHGNIFAVALLIHLQPSLESMINIENKSALDFALRNNRLDVVRFLTGDAETKINIINNELDKAFVNLELNKNIISKQMSDQALHICNNSNTIDIDSDEICEHVTYIDEYVLLLMTLSCFKVNYPNHPHYSNLFGDYDRDLQIAKNNSLLWRHEDSIKSGIALTIKLVMGFDKEFRRKYRINQQRVRRIIKDVNNEKYRIKSTTIPELEDRIKSITMALKRSNDPFILKTFQNLKDSTENELLFAKQILEENKALKKELEEVVAFLQFVKRDSSKIQNTASDTKRKLEEFLRNIECDRNNFQRHRNLSSIALDKIEQDAVEGEEQLKQFKQREQQLNKEIKEERQEIESLTNEYKKTIANEERARAEYVSKRFRSRTFIVFGSAAIAFLNPVYGLVALTGSLVSHTFLSKGANVRRYKEAKAFIMEQIEDKQAEIEQYRRLIIRNTKNIDDLEIDIEDYISLDKDLEIIHYKTNILTEHINKTLTSVDVIWREFNIVTTELTSLIELATTAKTEFEMENTKKIIYNELAKMECTWRDVYYKVMNFANCSPVYSF